MKKKRSNEKLSAKEKAVSGVSIKRFGITYLVLMGAFFFLIGYTPLQNIIDLNGIYTKGVVLVTAMVLGLLQIPCTYQGSLIQLPSIALDVKFGCNGLEAVMIYSVAVIAFPATWKKRIVGILAGFVILQLVNILRISALAYSGIHFKESFEYIHIYLAQGIMIAVSLGIFFIYLSYTTGSDRASA